MHTKDWEPCYNSGSDSVGLGWGLILTFLTSRCPVDHTEQQGLDLPGTGSPVTGSSHADWLPRHRACSRWGGWFDGPLHDSLVTSITYVLSRSTWCISKACTRFVSIYRHFRSLKLLIGDRFLSRGDRTVIDSTDFRVIQRWIPIPALPQQPNYRTFLSCLYVR